MSLSVIVLAAGMGKRMRSARPKVLHPVAGRPMLAHVLDTAHEIGADSIHVVHGHRGEAVQARFPGESLSWHLQAEQLGTGHAVMQALPAIDDADRVLVLCGDVPLITAATLRQLLDAAAAAEIAVLTARVDDPSGYGRVIRGESGHIVGIVEHRDATPDQRAIDEINTGIIMAGAQPLRRWLAGVTRDNTQGELYLTDVIGIAAREGARVASAGTEDVNEAMGINDRRQLAVAERLWQRREAGRLLDAGVTLADPERVDVRGSLTAGSDVRIDVGAVFEGDVTLGDGCTIGPYCVIRNSAIGAGTVLHPHCVVEDSAIGADCQIGPFARLRPATSLADRVKLGNFVETKKSRIESGSKVNHLSYVGDATVGSNVNIGAGTIVCNYDGANKHPTRIGDGVFIGSGTELVAPVTVEAGSTIGAGSTITKDAPAGKLTVARARQTTIDGWKRPVKKRD